MKAISEIGMSITPIRYYAWITLSVGRDQSIEIRFIGFYGVLAVESDFLGFHGRFR